jgi:hypothetical protein
VKPVANESSGANDQDDDRARTIVVAPYRTVLFQRLGWMAIVAALGLAESNLRGPELWFFAAGTVGALLGAGWQSVPSMDSFNQLPSENLVQRAIRSGLREFLEVVIFLALGLLVGAFFSLIGTLVAAYAAASTLTTANLLRRLISREVRGRSRLMCIQPTGWRVSFRHRDLTCYRA